MVKTEIDSISKIISSAGYAIHATFWERVTKDSIWKIVTFDLGLTDNLNLDFENREKDLSLLLETSTLELISYTYRF